VGIPLTRLTEGCCEALNTLDCIDMDEKKIAFDGSMASCDRVLECPTHFIYIEEKSFLLDFFNKIQKEYSCIMHIKDGEIPDEFLEYLHTISVESKKVNLALSIMDKMSSSAKKVKDTTVILCSDPAIDTNKLKNIPIVYVYCESGLEVDKLFSLMLTRYIKNKEIVIVECAKLEKFLRSNCA